MAQWSGSLVEEGNPGVELLESNLNGDSRGWVRTDNFKLV